MGQHPYYERVAFTSLAYSYSVFTMAGEKKGLLIRSHWHEELEFLWIEQGELVIQAGGERFSAGQGDIIAINPNEIHSIENAGEQYRYLVLIYNPETADTRPPTGIESNQLHYEFPHLLGSDPAVREVLNAIKEEAHHRMPGYEDMIKSALIRIVGLGKRYYGISLQPSANDRFHKVMYNIRTVLDYVHLHYNVTLAVGDMAAMAYMSKAHFCRMFKLTTGYSFIDYVQQIRLEEAERMLSSGQYAVYEAAEKVGYADANYFSRLYRRRFGRPPGRTARNAGIHGK